MIETREEWDGIELWSVHIGWKLSDEEKQMVFETLEALRAVARAADKWISEAFKNSPGHSKLENALSTLPPWLLEDNND